MGKTLEAQGGPFRRVLPTLQTSLTLPELPCTATAVLICKFFSVLKTAVAVQGSFWIGWEVRGICRVRLRARLVSGVRRECMPCAGGD